MRHDAGVGRSKPARKVARAPPVKAIKERVDLREASEREKAIATGCDEFETDRI
jgi:hypothetical protein